MKQYFQENRDALTREREISTEIFGHELWFFTNGGLFSCERIDEASRVLVENLPPIEGAVLDLGCGYGFIGIALAKMNRVALTMSDVNPVALEYAKKNAAENKITAEIILSDGFEKIRGAFDAIVLNPPIHAGKETVFRLYSDAAGFLAPCGAFYIVIQKKHGAETSIRRLREIFSCVEILHKKKGCFVVKSWNNFPPA